MKNEIRSISGFTHKSTTEVLGAGENLINTMLRSGVLVSKELGHGLTHLSVSNERVVNLDVDAVSSKFVDVIIDEDFNVVARGYDLSFDIEMLELKNLEAIQGKKAYLYERTKESRDRLFMAFLYNGEFLTFDCQKQELTDAFAIQSLTTDGRNTYILSDMYSTPDSNKVSLGLSLVGVIDNTTLDYTNKVFEKPGYWAEIELTGFHYAEPVFVLEYDSLSAEDIKRLADFRSSNNSTVGLTLYVPSERLEIGFEGYSVSARRRVSLGIDTKDVVNSIFGEGVKPRKYSEEKGVTKPQDLSWIFDTANKASTIGSALGGVVRDELLKVLRSTPVIEIVQQELEKKYPEDSDSTLYKLAMALHFDNEQEIRNLINSYVLENLD